MSGIRTDLAILVPDLFKDPSRIFVDGPAAIDHAMSHYLEELKLSISSNLDIVESVESASKQLEQHSNLISTRIQSVSESTTTLFQHNSSCLEKLQKTSTELSFAENALEALHLIRICREQYDPETDAVSICRHLVQVQSALARLATMVVAEDATLLSLRESISAGAHSIVDDIVLNRTFSEYAKFSRQTISLARKKAELRSQFNQSVAVLNPDDADRAFSSLKTLFWNEFFNPILLGTFIDVRRTSSERQEIVKLRRPTMLASVAKPGHHFPILQLRAIETLVGFMFEDVFDRCSWTMSQLGRRLWPELGETIVTRVLSASLPTDFAALDDYCSELKSSLDGFLRSLRSWHFIAESETTPLDSFLAEIRSQFCHVIPTRFVARARAAVLDDSMAVYSSLGSQLPSDDLCGNAGRLCHQVTEEFSRDNPGVGFTTNAVECALLVHFLLSQSVPKDVAETFGKAARAILFLFVTVRPVYHEKAFSSVASFRALHAVDCLLLCHHIARCIVLYNRCDIADYMNRLSRAARFSLEAQRQSLIEAAEHVRASLDSLARIDRKADYDAVVLGLNAQIRDWTMLQSVLTPILPESVVRRLLGQLCATIMEPLVLWTLGRTDIPEKSGNRLYAIFAIFVVFVEERKLMDSEEFSLLWRRFQAMQTILHPSQTLVGLIQACESQQLNMFSKQELKSLVCALFANVPRRCDLLALIDRMR